MPPNIKVCVNGFVLSTMLFDCCNNTTDQEGFLYGTVARNVRDEINDHSLAGTQEDILISVCSSMHFGNILSFYNEQGHLNKDDLELNLQDRKKKVIGWYRYRRYSSLYPSARETVVHHKLKQFFDAEIPNGAKYFVYAVFSSSNLPNFATHSYDYAFFTQRQNQTFKNLNVTILNLGDTRNSYRSGSMALPFTDSPSFNSVIFQYMNLQSFHKLEDNIQSFHLSLRSKLASLQEELAASDAVNAGLEKDIERLFNELQSLLASQEQQSSSSHSTPASHSTAASHSAASTSTVSETGPSDKESKSPPLKRAAVDVLVPEVSQKRVCLDKYFDAEGQELQMPSGSSENTDLPKVTTSKSKVVAADSHLMVVDPDNGEASSIPQNESEKPQVSGSMNDVNMVPSPSTTVEVVISDAGSQSFSEKESPDDDLTEDSTAVTDLTDVKEASDNKELDGRGAGDIKVSTGSKLPVDTAEPSLDSLRLDSSNPSDGVSTYSDPKLQKKVSSSKSDAKSEAFGGTEKNVFSSATCLKAENIHSADISKKTNTPFIIYATKKTDHSKDGATSSNSGKSLERNELANK